MKKTIVALIVMGSVAFGASATLTPNDKPDATKTTYAAGSQFGSLKLNDQLETGYVNGSPGLTFTGVTLDLNTVTEGTTRKYWTDDYTVSVWLANTTSTKVLFGYSYAWNGGVKSNAIVWDSTHQCIKMGVGTWTARTGGFTFDTAASVSSSNLQNYLTSGLTNITLAVDSNSESTSATLWVNGVKIEDLTGYDSKVTHTAGSASTAFMPYSSYNSQGALVGSIALTDKKLTTASEVATLADAKLAPEPATATLSLLALCGLAARRRRAHQA